jgi:hypothetical protein
MCPDRESERLTSPRSWKMPGRRGHLIVRWEPSAHLGVSRAARRLGDDADSLELTFLPLAYGHALKAGRPQRVRRELPLSGRVDFRSFSTSSAQRSVVERSATRLRSARDRRPDEVDASLPAPGGGPTGATTGDSLHSPTPTW